MYQTGNYKLKTSFVPGSIANMMLLLRRTLHRSTFNSASGCGSIF